MPSTIYAVLIADVMESRARADLRSLLGKKLAAISRRHLSRKLIQLPYSVTAGDEFQTVTRNLLSIPAVIRDLRAALRPLSLRIGVGFGSVSGRIQAPVNRLGGEAFQSAREAIESIKTDRKSTRLNSSHGYISYAVFCLKKKKQDTERMLQHSATPTHQRPSQKQNQFQSHD